MATIILKGTEETQIEIPIMLDQSLIIHWMKYNNKQNVSWKNWLILGHFKELGAYLRTSIVNRGLFCLLIIFWRVVSNIWEMENSLFSDIVMKKLKALHQILFCCNPSKVVKCQNWLLGLWWHTIERNEVLKKKKIKYCYTSPELKQD